MKSDEGQNSFKDEVKNFQAQEEKKLQSKKIKIQYVSKALEKAKYELSCKNYGQGQKWLKQCIEINPYSIQYYQLLIDSFLESANYKEIDFYLAQAIDKIQQSYVWIQKAEDVCNKEKGHHSLRLTFKLSKMYPQFTHFYRTCLMAATSTIKIDVFLQILDEELSHEIHLKYLYNWIKGLIYCCQDKVAAIQLFKQSFKLNPTFYVAFCSLYYQLKYYKFGYEYIQKNCLQQIPEIRIALNKVQNEQALTEIDSLCGDALMALAEIFQKLHLLTKANECYTYLINISQKLFAGEQSSRRQALFSLSRNCIKMGKWNQAANYFVEWLKLDILEQWMLASVHSGLALCFCRQKQYQKALNSAEASEMEIKFPQYVDYAVAYVDLLSVYHELKLPYKVIQIYQKWIKNQKKEYRHVQLYLAKIYSLHAYDMLHQQDNASTLFQQVIKSANYTKNIEMIVYGPWYRLIDYCLCKGFVQKAKQFLTITARQVKYYNDINEIDYSYLNEQLDSYIKKFQEKSMLAGTE